MSESSVEKGPIRSPLIESLFPSIVNGVAFSSSAALDETKIQTYDAEPTDAFVPSRRAEFITGRACARAAMNVLGLEMAPIPVGPRREPVWPDGITGSISHTRRADPYFVAAIVAHTQQAGPPMGIGLDAEVIQPLDRDVRRRILTASEIEMVDALPRAERDLAIIRVFSAKEAFYKAQYPLTRAWVGFEDMWMPALGDWLEGSSPQSKDHVALSQLKVPVAVHQVVHDGLVISGVVVFGAREFFASNCR